MKAAVLHQLGTLPVYEDFADPTPQNADQLVMNVKAASIKNLDKARASGKHYASYSSLPAVVGFDGVGILDDGTRVYAQGLTGTIAEKAVIAGKGYVKLPDTLDDVTAAALPNAVMGAALALRFRANIQANAVVLINGATGVTGMVAVQLAKHYGASKVIATGRNQESLEKLKTLGADEIISLHQDDDAFSGQLRAIHADTPIDIVIDYLWGHPITLIINTLKEGSPNTVAHPIRIVAVGSMAGEHIDVASGTLRSSAIELLGSGLGSISKQQMHEYTTDMLPEMFQLAADGKLVIDTELTTLSAIETAWQQAVAPGKRLVVSI
ncbi:quinone oxidoreductase family protein [Spirosoma fluminis]